MPSPYSYRAPEMLGNSVKYSTAVDLWSLGCTMYEFIRNVVLFQVGLDAYIMLG